MCGVPAGSVFSGQAAEFQVDCTRLEEAKIDKTEDCRTCGSGGYLQSSFI